MVRSTAKKFYFKLEYLGQPGGASHGGWLGNILLGIETVQSGAPYVLTDPIKVILFIKIVVSSWEVSCQYSLNKNYEICRLQETLTVLKPHKPKEF